MTGGVVWREAQGQKERYKMTGKTVKRENKRNIYMNNSYKHESSSIKKRRFMAWRVVCL